jgi:histidinol phosphatase-like PHP family hydrolase
MARQAIIDIHIRDGVSKTFHISEDEIIMHVDVSDKDYIVPERHRKALMKMADIASKKADDTMIIVGYNVSGDIDGIGDKAQEIWEDIINE